jgi:serine/threonine protein phosphatase PrpC
MVIAVPDVTETVISDDIQYIFLACDGIWDVKSNQEVINAISSKQPLLDNKLYDLLDSCLHEVDPNQGSTDNMTCILVELKHLFFQK